MGPDSAWSLLSWLPLTFLQQWPCTSALVSPRSERLLGDERFSLLPSLCPLLCWLPAVCLLQAGQERLLGSVRGHGLLLLEFCWGGTEICSGALGWDRWSAGGERAAEQSAPPGSTLCLQHGWHQLRVGAAAALFASLWILLLGSPDAC